MEVFIDKEFLIKLFDLLANSAFSTVTQDVIHFLSRLSNVKIYSNISDKEYEDNVVYRKLTNFGVLFPEYISHLTERIENGSFIGPSNFKLFFVESPKADEVIIRAGFQNFNSKTISDRWQPFSSSRENLEIPISEECSSLLINWQFLHSFRHPNRSIIITDRYMFKSVERVKENLVPLIKSLIKKANRWKVEIILIGLFEDRSGRYPMRQIFTLLNDSATEVCSVNIHLINLKLSVHSRGVISSYWYINPDTSFDFIKYGRLRKHVDGNIYHGFLFRPTKIRLVKQALATLRGHLSASKVLYYDNETGNIGPYTKASDLLKFFQ